MPCAFHLERPLPFEHLGPGCQFNVAEDELIEFEGKAWCPFHLPMESADGSPSPKADWGREEEEKEKIQEFNEAIFGFINTLGQGKPIDLTGVVFPGHISFASYWRSDYPVPHITFSGAQFSGTANFSGAPGGNDQSAGRLSYRFHRVNFAGAKFLSEVRFTNRHFLDTTDFSGAVFASAPEFHNCVLHQDTDFTGADFRDRSGEAAPAYRTLKLAMGRARAVDEEAMFYALEMECRRKREDTPLSVKVLSRLYEWAADYGRSFMRPFYRLLGFCGVFFLIYLAAFTSNPVPWDIPITWDITAGVGRFTVAQVVRPFSAFTLTEGVTVGSESVEVSFGLACVAAIQSILSLGLIALFILALRRRFRMG